MTVDKTKSFQQAQVKADSATKAASFRAAVAKQGGIIAQEFAKRGIDLRNAEFEK